MAIQSLNNCILCTSQNIQTINILSVTELVSRWRQSFDIDIQSELNNRREIHCYQCLDCDIQFFPPELAGSERLYAELQAFDWYYMPHKWEHAMAAEDVLPGDRVLEIGCGLGEFVEWLNCKKNTKAYGIELNPSAVEKARSLKRPVIRERLEETVNREKSAFDVVCSFQVLEHVANPRDFLLQSLQLLKPGGRLIFCVPNAESFLKYQFNLLDMPPHHVSRWSHECIRSLPHLFDVKLCRLLNEPLAEYHIDGYLNTYIGRIRNRWLQAFLRRLHAKECLKWVLGHASIRYLVEGQSVYACITKL